MNVSPMNHVMNFQRKRSSKRGRVEADKDFDIGV